jgi:hypothetical protein
MGEVEISIEVITLIDGELPDSHKIQKITIHECQ